MQTGLLHESDHAIGYAFVNETSRALRLLTQPISLESRVFHIDNPHKVRFSELFKLAGVNVKILPQEKLVSELRSLSHSKDETTRQAAMEYLGKVLQDAANKDTNDITEGEVKLDATLLLLRRLGFEWSQLTDEYIQCI